MEILHKVVKLTPNGRVTLLLSVSEERINRAHSVSKKYIHSSFLCVDGKKITTDCVHTDLAYEMLKTFGSGLFTAADDNEIFSLASRTVNQVKQKSLKFEDSGIYLSRIEVNTMIRRWHRSYIGYSLTKSLESDISDPVIVITADYKKDLEDSGLPIPVPVLSRKVLEELSDTALLDTCKQNMGTVHDSVSTSSSS